MSGDSNDDLAFSSANTASDVVFKQAAKQHALHLLQQEHGLAPTFMEDIYTLEEAQALGTAAPFLMVWSPTDHLPNEFAVAANLHYVEIALLTFLHELDPYFETVKDELSQDLIQMTGNSLSATINKTGVSLKAVCEASFLAETVKTLQQTSAFPTH
jgi:hypothetical protein